MQQDTAIKCHDTDSPDTAVKVWHWLLAGAITFSYATAELGYEWLYWHIHSGILILSLLVFRLYWGLTGPANSRFQLTVPGLLRQNKARKRATHSNIAAIVLLCLVLAQAISGLFSVDDVIDITGPFYSLASQPFNEAMTAYHHDLSIALIWMIVLHLAAISFYFFLLDKDLLSPMLCRKHERLDNKYVTDLITAIFLAITMFTGIESGIFVHLLQQVSI